MSFNNIVIANPEPKELTFGDLDIGDVFITRLGAQNPNESYVWEKVVGHSHDDAVPIVHIPRGEGIRALRHGHMHRETVVYRVDVDVILTRKDR